MRDYSYLALGVVLIVALAAILTILHPSLGSFGLDNSVGYNALVPTDNEAPITYELVVGETLTLSDDEMDYVFSAPNAQTVTLNSEPHTQSFRYGERYFALEFPTTSSNPITITPYYSYKYAPTCVGITGQTFTTGERAACCDGLLKQLPDCTQDNPASVVCGERRIYCEGTSLVSEVNS